MDKRLKDLSDEYNSHPREAERLLGLCDGDYKKLSEVYFRRRLINHSTGTPGNKKEIKRLLAVPLTIKHKATGYIGQVQIEYGSLLKERGRMYGCTGFGFSKEDPFYFWQNTWKFDMYQYPKNRTKQVILFLLGATALLCAISPFI